MGITHSSTYTVHVHVHMYLSRGQVKLPHIFQCVQSGQGAGQNYPRELENVLSMAIISPIGTHKDTDSEIAYITIGAMARLVIQTIIFLI